MNTAATTIEPTSDAATRVVLAEHMQRAVRGPLAALRAVLEGQRHKEAYVDRALGELAAVEHAVDDLWRWTSPMPLRRTTCNVAELVASVRAGLDEAERARLWLVVEQGEVTLDTDGALLIATLRRFVRASLNRDGREVLMHVHADEDAATLSVVDDLTDGDATGLEPERLDLPLLLGRRDVARLGGTCTVHHSTPQHRCIVLRFPRRGAAR